MQYNPVTTIATVTVATGVQVDFDLILAELEYTLTAPGQPRFWLDRSDLEIGVFDFESTRIVLANAPSVTAGEPGHFLVGVGPPPEDVFNKHPAKPYWLLCENIVSGISDFYAAERVFWQEISDVLRAEDLHGYFPPPRRVGEGKTNVIPLTEVRDAAGTANLPLVANDDGASNLDCSRLMSVRDALYTESHRVEPRNADSTLNRLSAVAIDTTMMMVCLPAGAAMLTYHVLRGGEMRRTAHMVTLTGLFMTASHSAMAQNLLAALAI